MVRAAEPLRTGFAMKMKARIVLLLFATPFAGFGLWAGFAIASDVYDAWRMSNWMATEAQLIDAGYTSHAGDDSTTYEAYASYRYLVHCRRQRQYR